MSSISRLNPMKAYQLGRIEGEKQAKALDIRRGINLALAYVLLSMDYINEKDDGTVFLSKPKFKEFYQLTMEELSKRIEESIEGEQGIDTYDIADLYIAHDTRARKKYDLPLKKYDGKDEVL